MGQIKLTDLGPSGMTTRSKFTLILIIRCPFSGAIIAATLAQSAHKRANHPMWYDN